MLASVAGRYVFVDVGCHTRPRVVTAYEFRCLLHTMVASGALVMGLGEKGGAEVVVVRDINLLVVGNERLGVGEMAEGPFLFLCAG